MTKIGLRTSKTSSMKDRLQEIYREAVEDSYGVSLDGPGYESRIMFGVKIVQDIPTKEVEIINTLQGGDYYKPLSENELDNFLSGGWRYGVYQLCLSNYRNKLNLIEQRIQKEINGRASAKQVGLLKAQRKRIMNKYTEINFKLNNYNNDNQTKDSKKDNDNL